MSKRRMLLTKKKDKGVNYLKSLISTGTQCIDTGIIPDSETVIEASLYIEANHKGYENYFGCSGNQCALIWNASQINSMRTSIRDSNTLFSFVVPNKMDIAIDIAQKKAVVNEAEINLQVGTNEINTTMCIFAKKKLNSNVLDVPGIFKLYSFAMTKAGQKVIDLKPALDPSNVPCLYDEVSKEYFYNSGTGEFEYEELESYDLEWDYTMGLPEDNGFEKYCEGTPDSYEMTDDGLKVKVTATQYVRLNPLESSLQFCNEGIFEVKIMINYFCVGAQNGFRLILSDGEGGCHIQIRSYQNNTMFYNTIPNVHTAITSKQLQINTDYTIRIERRQNVSYVYVDNEQVYSTDVKSTGYAQYNRIFFQTGGEYILKSIKFKKIS